MGKIAIKEGFTHGGVFHADDVFATALLKILNPDIRIFRGFAVPDGFEGIVYDIGGGEYDHHQKDGRIRKNGVPYAAFGLLWEQFGSLLLSEEDAKEFDKRFVQPLDETDNTGIGNMLSQIIADKNPTWQETSADMEEAFAQAVEFAGEILKGRFRQITADRCAYETVREKAEACQDGILYLASAMPWKEAVKEQGDIIYVIYPSMRGGYNIQAVPDAQNENRLKRPFPEGWRGASAEELKSQTGIKDLNFCHRTGFLCVAKTLEGAYDTARLSMEEHTA